MRERKGAILRAWLPGDLRSGGVLGDYQNDANSGKFIEPENLPGWLHPGNSSSTFRQSRIQVPQGWFVKNGRLGQHANPKFNNVTHYMQLKRNLYSCKQVAHNWFQHLIKGLLKTWICPVKNGHMLVFMQWLYLGYICWWLSHFCWAWPYSRFIDSSPFKKLLIARRGRC